MGTPFLQVRQRPGEPAARRVSSASYLGEIAREIGRAFSRLRRLRWQAAFENGESQIRLNYVGGSFFRELSRTGTGTEKGAGSAGRTVPVDRV